MEVRATKSNTTFPDKPEVVIRRNAPTSESKHGYLGACAGDKNASPQKHCDGQNKYLVRIDALRRLRFKAVFLCRQERKGASGILSLLCLQGKQR